MLRQIARDLKTVESWTRAFSDYTDRNGRTWGYGVTVLENGDKIFSRFDGTSETYVDSSGSKITTYSGVAKYTEGTGKYVGIRGVSRATTKADLARISHTE